MLSTTDSQYVWQTMWMSSALETYVKKKKLVTKAFSKTIS